MHALTFTPAVLSAFRARPQRRERCVAPRAQRSFVVRADGEEIDPDEVMLDMEERMEKSIDSIRTNFNTVRTGRANAAILDRVEVEYYGAMTPLKSIANATTPDAQTILIQPFDKGAINDIERALMMSDLGLTPGNDGNAIRLNIPSLTADRRKELAKVPKVTFNATFFSSDDLEEKDEKDDRKQQSAKPKPSGGKGKGKAESESKTS